MQFYRSRCPDTGAGALNGPSASRNRLATVAKGIVNRTVAIANYVLRTSPAIADRVAQAEAELARLKASAQPVNGGAGRPAPSRPRVLNGPSISRPTPR